jgi:hypothetical protein
VPQASCLLETSKQTTREAPSESKQASKHPPPLPPLTHCTQTERAAPPFLPYRHTDVKLWRRCAFLTAAAADIVRHFGSVHKYRATGEVSVSLFASFESKTTGNIMRCLSSLVASALVRIGSAFLAHQTKPKYLFYHFL